MVKVAGTLSKSTEVMKLVNDMMKVRFPLAAWLRPASPMRPFGSSSTKRAPPCSHPILLGSHKGPVC